MKHIVVIGGGVAGVQCATSLSKNGINVTLIEKDDRLGGKLNNWHHLFPSFASAKELLGGMLAELKSTSTKIILSKEVVDISPKSVELEDGIKIECDGVVLATGYDIFNAEIKEELGYGIYNNVFTTVDMEKMFHSGEIKTADGKTPERIALLHCVGSRDEKVCQRHCSRVCCIEGVKQAMALKKRLPEAEIFNFYMDMRMFGPGYEEMYRQAQEEFNIHFVRGRISEAGESIDGKIQIKAEDTLVGRPMKMSVDMLILIVGMKAAKSNKVFAERSSLNLYNSGFIKPLDLFTNGTKTSQEGIYVIGTASAPKTIGESINEAITAANQIAQNIR